MSLTLKIALRYLRSKKAHSAVNIISGISVCGVVVATAALICVLSVFNGFRGLIEGKLAKLDPEIAITAVEGKTVANGDSVASVVSSIAGVECAVPTVEDHALAVFFDNQMPLRVKGVPADYAKVTDVKKTVVDGDFVLDDTVSQYVVLGAGPAIRLGARPGFLKMVSFFAPKRKGQVNVANPATAFRSDSLFVSGVFQVEQSEYDRDLVFVPLVTARALFDYTTEATTVEVKLSPNANEAAVMDAMQQRLGNKYSIKNRLMQQAAAFRMVNVEKWVTFLLLAFILVIATFNVISALSLLIIEKDESIRTFRNLGASNSQITRIFVVEGWLISLIGAVVGVALGLVLCLLQQNFGIIKLAGNSDVMLLHAYPVAVEWTDVIVVFLLVAIVGLFTSFITSLTVQARLKK